VDERSLCVMYKASLHKVKWKHCCAVKLFYGRNLISEFVWIRLGVLNVDDCSVLFLKTLWHNTIKPNSSPREHAQLLYKNTYVYGLYFIEESWRVFRFYLKITKYIFLSWVTLDCLYPWKLSRVKIRSPLSLNFTDYQ